MGRCGMNGRRVVVDGAREAARGREPARSGWAGAGGPTAPGRGAGRALGGRVGWAASTRIRQRAVSARAGGGRRLPGGEPGAGVDGGVRWRRGRRPAQGRRLDVGAPVRRLRLSRRRARRRPSRRASPQKSTDSRAAYHWDERADRVAAQRAGRARADLRAGAAAGARTGRPARWGSRCGWPGASSRAWSTAGQGVSFADAGGLDAPRPIGGSSSSTPRARLPAWFEPDERIVRLRVDDRRGGLPADHRPARPAGLPQGLQHRGG